MPRKPDPLGRRALFSQTPDPSDTQKGSREIEPGPDSDLGRRSIFTDQKVRVEKARELTRNSNLPGDGVVPKRLPIELECASCHKVSKVDLVNYLALHLPMFIWHPGRGFTRFMRCPACRQHTWVSASWKG